MLVGFRNQGLYIGIRDWRFWNQKLSRLRLQLQVENQVAQPGLLQAHVHAKA